MFFVQCAVHFTLFYIALWTVMLRLCYHILDLVQFSVQHNRLFNSAQSNVALMGSCPCPDLSHPLDPIVYDKLLDYTKNYNILVYLRFLSWQRSKDRPWPWQPFFGSRGMTIQAVTQGKNKLPHTEYTLDPKALNNNYQGGWWEELLTPLTPALLGAEIIMNVEVLEWSRT